MDEVFFFHWSPLWPDQFLKQLVDHMAIPINRIHAALSYQLQHVFLIILFHMPSLHSRQQEMSMEQLVLEQLIFLYYEIYLKKKNYLIINEIKNKKNYFEISPRNETA